MVNIYKDCFSDNYDELAQRFLDYPKAIESFKGLINKSDRLFEIGVGTGLFSIPLYKQGFSIEGIDVSPEMIKILKRKCPDFPTHVADISSYKFDKKYDVIFMHSSVFLLTRMKSGLIFESYVNGTENVYRVAKSVFEAMAEKGSFIINIQHNPPEINLDKDIVYRMRSEYNLDEDKVSKEHLFTKNRKILQRNIITKYAARYEDFVSMLKKVGMNDSGFSDDGMWLILK